MAYHDQGYNSGDNQEINYVVPFVEANLGAPISNHAALVAEAIQAARVAETNQVVPVAGTYLQYIS